MIKRDWSKRHNNNDMEHETCKQKLNPHVTACGGVKKVK